MTMQMLMVMVFQMVAIHVMLGTAIMTASVMMLMCA